MAATRKRTSTGRRSRSVAPPLQPRPRTHAFTGCLTCRERHVKCDLGQPSCMNCTRLEITCEGYNRRYSWMPAKIPGQKKKQRKKAPPDDLDSVEPLDDDDEGQSSRRVLFSDADRMAMVVQMRNECCSHYSTLDLDRVLRDLQEAVPKSSEFTRIGPFGILNVESEASPPMIAESCGIVEENQNLEDRISTPNLHASLSQFVWGEQEELQAWDALENHIPVADDTRPECAPDGETCDEETAPNWELSINLSSANHSYNLNDMQDESLQSEEQSGQSLEYLAAALLDGTGTNSSGTMILDTEIRNSAPTILTMSNDANLSKIPTEARLLLDYYSTRIIDVMSMSPEHKPPWKTIHLPCAMSALAEQLVYGEARSLAKMALFYALLSISSYHMGSADKDSVDRAQYWIARGAVHKKNAEAYLRSALDNTKSKASRGKYKEILMSVLSMVTIGVFSGNMQDAHAYLVESETLIRNFGLPKPFKSQKVSKLHHIFSFLRIIEESTSLAAINEKESSEESNSDGQSPMERNETENSLVLSNDRTQSANSRLAWVEEDEPEYPEEDSLFVSIYQMPTTLLSLLSQTSSLCKQLQTIEASTPQFSRRCQIIEDRIFKWKAPKGLTLPNYWGTCNLFSEQDSPGTPNASTVAAHLVTAMHHALIVHFQRQIRNTDPRVLQHYVTSTTDHLLAHEQLKKSLHVSTAPFLWPGFIAGCEAFDLSARRKIEAYLDIIRDYNVGSLTEAEKVMREVWRRQDQGRTDRCWENVLKDWGMNIVLT